METGDFMLRYEINNREYIIYSPEQGEVSCLELQYFRDLTAFQLAILLDWKRQSDAEDQPEFAFEYTCSREQLLTYLFDIESSLPGSIRKKRRVSGYEGYFLFGIKNPQKIVNFFQYDGSGHDNLVFYDTLGFTTLGDENDTVHITWSPFQFSLLEEGIENQAYLLASSNLMLLTFIFPKVSGKRIVLHSQSNPLESLLFLAYFTSFSGNEKSIQIHESREEIIVSLDRWNPITVVRFVSRMNKSANAEWKEILSGSDSDDFTTFRLQSVGGVSFVMFPNLPTAINIFLDALILEIGLGEKFSLC